MIHISFEGGLGNQMFQYAYGRFLQNYYKDSVCFDISKYDFEKSENREFDLYDMNIVKDWQQVEVKRNRMARYGIRYIPYLGATAVYTLLNKLMKDTTYMHGVHVYQRFINLFGFYRNNTHEFYYEPIHKSLFSKKFIRGHWFNPDVVKKMDTELRKELRVKTEINQENRKILDMISRTESVAVHIRRGDYVTLGYVVCSVQYYVKCMQEMKERLKDPFFFVFSDDIEWVRKELKFDGKMVFVNLDNKAVDDMRLLYSCKHFIMSNSTFSWWGAWLSENPNKIILQPKYWKNSDYEAYVLKMPEWETRDNHIV